MSEQGGTRIGVAIPVPLPLCEVLQRQRAASGDPLAWSVPPHVTLVPPLRVADGDMDRVAEHLAAAAAASAVFEIALHSTGTFRPVSPVVFARLVSGAAEVVGLEQRVRAGVLGTPRRFPFHPHVTLAQDVDDAALDAAGAALADFRAQFTAASIVLYRHEADGVWRSLAEYPLG